MSIQLQFISLIIPIATIEQKYPGGWTQCKNDYGLGDTSDQSAGRLRYDDHLFKDGTMNPHDMEHLVKEWESMGFIGIAEENGEQVWKDMCVVDELFGPTLPCDWIQYDSKSRTVSEIDAI